MKTGSKESIVAHKALQKIKNILYDGKNARKAELNEEEKKEIKGLSLLTMKPVLYIANCSEEQLGEISNIQETITNKYNNLAIKQFSNLIPISAKVEEELNSLTNEEKEEYLDSLGLKEFGLNRLIKEAYKILGLITYFTSGEPETRAWTIKDGSTAPQAAGVIHTDFERGFIAADIVGWLDLVNQGGWTSARTKGLVRTEGKNYIMRDGDTVLFKFNV